MRKGVATADEVIASTPPPPPAERSGRRVWSRVRGRVASTDPLVGVVGLVAGIGGVAFGMSARRQAEGGRASMPRAA